MLNIAQAYQFKRDVKMVNVLPSLHNMRSVPIGAGAGDGTRFELHLNMALYKEMQVPLLDAVDPPLPEDAYVLQMKVTGVKDAVVRKRIAFAIAAMFKPQMTKTNDVLKAFASRHVIFDREKSCSQQFETHYYWYTRSTEQKEAVKNLLLSFGSLSALAASALGSPSQTPFIAGRMYKYSPKFVDTNTIKLNGATSIDSHVAFSFVV